ncbi:A24 family peptidase [Effusibacillus lacus]|uniref:Peptidase A24 n=1 Tax=Effusibacillus lacus TaxID=1348429 RepID=A0A292YEG3_9BACL|nr:prepilin peptidase [Effusibacillus lacus]TCS70381.1 prepilin peptidase CpaA [Effusibacillus lacus]GAX91532.1 peptidase A24 [Effusibacillus lacus]
MEDYVLGAGLLISLVTDLRSRKILNVVTLPVIGIAVVYHTVVSGWDGLVFSVSGLLFGFGLLFIPYLLGGMGAGDVKLLAAIGSLKGAAFVFSSFLYTCLIGGVISLIILAVRKQLGKSMHRIGHALVCMRGSAESFNVLEKSELHHAFPYGVAIVLGSLSAYLWGGF